LLLLLPKPKITLVGTTSNLDSLPWNGPVYNTPTWAVFLPVAHPPPGPLVWSPTFWQFSTAFRSSPSSLQSDGGWSCPCCWALSFEELHNQFAHGLQDLPFSKHHNIEGHYVDSLLCTALMDCQQWLAHIALANQVGQQQCQAGIQGMQAALHTFLHPPPPTPIGHWTSSGLWPFSLHCSNR